jgi:L-alanine-DL-glutamate epimerase-like enolase superfamily enzyme
MKITDLKCAVFGNHPIVRITTDEGIDGFAEIEFPKPYIKPQVLFYKEFIVGQDPTNVERVVKRIRRMGAFKPWGSAVSAIEMALWDIAGKAAGVPVYKLLGGKVRDRVRVYNGNVRFPFNEYTPEGFAENMAKMKASPEGFTIIKQALAFHSPTMFQRIPDLHYGEVQEGARYANYGTLTERGFKHLVACVEAMKAVLGDEVGLALDLGPGWTPKDVIRFANAVEHLNILWLEDTIAGDYTPYTMAQAYRDIKMSTRVPIHTGEQIYLRHNFRELIEMRAVDIVGPDPCDVGGIAELKWVAEYAEIHGIQMAPHGTANGVLGLAALVQVAAALPDNFIAFEYPTGKPEWWYDIVDGFSNPMVVDGFIEVWDAPGMGVTLNPEKTRPYLSPEDADFFD